MPELCMLYAGRSLSYIFIYVYERREWLKENELEENKALCELNPCHIFASLCLQMYGRKFVA